MEKLKPCSAMSLVRGTFSLGNRLFLVIPKLSYALGTSRNVFQKYFNEVI